MTKTIEIKVKWCVDDVLMAYPELTKNQALRVLEEMKAHRALFVEYGWTVMEACIDNLVCA